jgi:putative glutamine amidotransferase
MKRLFLVLIAILCLSAAFSQDFFNSEFNKRKNYIILTNPTVGNLKTIQYLVNARLLDISTKKTKFVGVYYNEQDYDFNETKLYIENNKLENFFLYEIKGELNEENLFQQNDCSAQLKKVFDNSIGVFFFGGPDIPPAFMAKKTHFR